MTDARHHAYRLMYGESSGNPPEVIRAASSTAAVAARATRELPVQITDMTLLQEWSARNTREAIR